MFRSSIRWGIRFLTAVGEMASGTNDANPGRPPPGITASCPALVRLRRGALRDAKLSVNLTNRDLPIFYGSELVWRL